MDKKGNRVLERVSVHCGGNCGNNVQYIAVRSFTLLLSKRVVIIDAPREAV
jgi:hypothetical protein